MYVCVHSTVKTTQFILHTMYVCMYVWIYVAYTYVTRFAKTQHNGAY